MGIQAKIVPVEWETWLTDVYAGRNFDATVIGFTANTLNAGALLNRFVSDNESNMINFNNAEYDALIAKAAASTDDAEQTALYKEAAALLTTTAANIYVQDMADFMLVKSGVEGYVFYPMYVMDLATVHYVQ